MTKLTTFLGVIAFLFFSDFFVKTSDAVTDDPYQLLTDHFNAIGGLERIKAITSRRSEGKIRSDGLHGTFRHWQKRSLRYRTEKNYSIINSVEGDSGEQSWFFDTNGQVLINRDHKTLERRRIGQMMDRFEHLNSLSRDFSLTYKGIAKVDDQNCYEIILTNTINSDRTHYYLDTKSLRMVQSMDRLPDVTITTHYDDFRSVAGVLIPFHVASTYLPWQKEEEIWVSNYSINDDIDSQLFVLPQSVKDYRFKDKVPSVSISFELNENLMYLPVTIAGDTKLWVLDSGASMSVIDKEYALSLGLDLQGRIKGYGFGDLFELGFVSIPKYRIADIHFDSQKVYVADNLSRNSYEPVIYGILGYDFLSRFIVEINYDTQIITFHAPDTFVYKGSGLTFEAPLKYRTFTLPVTLNNNHKALWSVDLGSHQSSIHYPFAQEQGILSDTGVETVSQGMSGVTFSRLTQFDCLAVEGLSLDNQLVSIPTEQGQGATALGEVGGNLGNSTLRNFHLYLNYPKQQIILEKGQAFNHKFERDKSGLLIGRSKGKQPMISYLDKRGPAFRGGARVGDLLLEVNNKPIEKGSPIMPIRKILRGAQGDSIQLKVLRGEERLVTRFILEDLYQIKSEICGENP
jgi:Aspartyl protease/PDZ domain